MKNILAVSGSLRTQSANLKILEHIAEMFAGEANFKIYDDLAGLPPFNPDLDTASPPFEVESWREQIKNADAVLICTPEYIFGVPGALKNAIDWTVSSAEFMYKPTALITASSLGEKAHESFLLTLKTIEAKIDETTSLLISGARTKLNGEGKIADEKTLDSVRKLMNALLTDINR